MNGPFDFIPSPREIRDADVRRYAQLGIEVTADDWQSSIVRGYCLEQIAKLMGPQETTRAETRAEIPQEIFDALIRYEDAHRVYALDMNAASNARSLTKKGNALIDAEAELLSAFRRARSRG